MGDHDKRRKQEITDEEIFIMISEVTNDVTPSMQHKHENVAIQISIDNDIELLLSINLSSHNSIIDCADA